MIRRLLTILFRKEIDAAVAVLVEHRVAQVVDARIAQALVAERVAKVAVNDHPRIVNVGVEFDGNFEYGA